MNRASSLKAAAALSDIHTEKKGKERKGRSTPVEEYCWHLKCVLRLQWESATLPCRIADRLLEYVKVSQRHHVHRDLNKEEAAKYPLIMLSSILSPSLPIQTLSHPTHDAVTGARCLGYSRIWHKVFGFYVRDWSDKHWALPSTCC